MADFTELLRDQIRHGLTAAQQYLAAAVYFDAQRLPQLAGQTYSHSSRHRAHALRMVQYLLDRDVAVRVGGLDEVRPDFDSPRDAIAFLLAREETITTQISTLAATARAANDYLGEQFTQWFLKEQVDEMSALTTLLEVLDRDGNLFDVEEFVRRELAGAAKTATRMPKMAGEGHI
ncbi:ferritin-like domain-containing protein [Nocardia rosealba]|uniref:ferritin n=1 Tax=Nocardia TaxID=1817 RepID=UPI001CD9DC70|nr:ferritin-like domain-containing protein [Nocardia rosealba]MCA2209930.1 ferritin [Nocardia rosealba]